VHVVASIQARLGSTRLPGKVLYTIANKKILEWVEERVNKSSAVDSVYVAVGDNPENDAVVELCEREQTVYIQGPEDNLLQRHKLVADSSKCDIFCRVTGDCPFVPPSEITRTIEAHLNNQNRYTTNHTPEMPIGTAVDVLNRNLLEELADRGDRHPVKRLRENPEQWGTVYTDDERWTQFSEAHTAIDTPNDYWRLVDAIDAVGTDPFDVTQWVAEQN